MTTMTRPRSRPAVFPLRVLYSYRHSAIDHITKWRKKTAKSDGRGFRFLRCFQQMQTIRGAPDERDLYVLKSLHFEKLKGQHSHQHSIRLNDQWRLILEFKGKAPNKTVVIVAIEDYH